MRLKLILYLEDQKTEPILPKYLSHFFDLKTKMQLSISILCSLLELVEIGQQNFCSRLPTVYNVVVITDVAESFFWLLPRF